MSTSFAKLLRQSKLASYDRALPQVYATSAKRKSVGNWGLKRNLPSVIRTNYVTIGDLDTAEHQTPWQSGNQQVFFVKRWKENFPNSQKPKPRVHSDRHNVAVMSPSEFKQFLKSAIKQAPAFRQAIQRKDMSPDQIFDFLDVDTHPDATRTAPVSPTYSNHDQGWNYAVQGRILNADVSGHAVGIAGIVCLLPRRYAIGLRYVGDRHTRTFYVMEAGIDEQGRPDVKVKLAEDDPLGSQSLFAGIFDGDETKESITNPTDDEDNILPNKHHRQLMERITDLFSKDKKHGE